MPQTLPGDDVLTKSQLKGVFTKYDFRPLKRFGENYLIDGNIKDKIVKAADLRRGDVALEIGPGLGALTIDLAATGASIYAVERDKKAFAILQDLAGDKHPNLKIVSGDILEYDLNSISQAGKIKVIGNLPYYITTPIIEYLIERRKQIRSVLILVQHEVANRLMAKPGSKEYSSISCFVQYFTKVEYLYTIKRTSFYPEPEVDSSLIRLDVLERPSVDVRDEELFFKIVRGSFNQRRKSILNSLSREEVLDMAKSELEVVLAKIGIDPIARPETLSLSKFASLSNALAE